MKSIFKGFSCLLLLQIAIALPLQKRDADRFVLMRDPNTEEWIIAIPHPQSPEERLFRRTLPHIVSMSKFFMRDGVDMLEHSIDELKKLPNRSAALRANITRMDNFIRKYEDSRVTEDNAMDILGDFINIVSDVENMPDNSELKKQLKTAFDASDYSNFTQKAEQKWKDFFDNFKGPLEEFVNDLSAYERRKKYADVVELYEKMKKDEASSDMTDQNLFGFLFNAY